MDGIIFGDCDESLWSDVESDPGYESPPPPPPDDCWVTANGRIIPFVEMTDDHLRNAIRYFNRRKQDVRFFPKRVAGLYTERSRRQREWWLSLFRRLRRLIHA